MIVGISAGTGTFCKSLGAGLRKLHGEEFQVSLLTFRPDADKPENAENFDATFVLSSSVHEDWRRSFELPAAVVKLRRAVKKIGPDLVFAIGTFANVAAALSITECPVVLSEHLNMTLRLKDSRFGAVTKLIMRQAYPNRLMVVASHELANDMQSSFAVNRIEVVPNGIDAQIIRKRAAEPSNVAPPARYFISVGRLSPQKDVATMIRAFAEARGAGMTEELLIVGDGEQRPMLEALSHELNVADWVHFAGHCANPYPLIAGARALVLTSIWEGFAYVPIEAMALGVPVIATACPSGPAEILGDGKWGMLVPPGAIAAVADAMKIVSSDDAVHSKLSAAASERGAQLSVGAMVEGYREIFLKELAANP